MLLRNKHERIPMKRNINLMYIMALLQGMVFYGPVATLYRQVRGVSIFQITLIEGISYALCLILEVPWGVVADRIGYRRTLVFCSWLYFLSKIVFWLAWDFNTFLLERVMLSVVFSGLSGVDSSILYLSAQGEDTQRVYGRYNTMGMVGLLLAAFVFSVVIQDNYSLAGLLTAISYGAAALLSLGIQEVNPPKSEKASQEPFMTTLREVLGNQTLILFLIAVAFLTEAHQTITVFLNQMKYESCGLDHTAIGVIYSIATLLGLLGVCSAGVTRKLGQLRSLVLFCALPIASCLLLSLTETAVPSVLGVLTLRVSDTLFQPFQQDIQNRQVKTQNRATALSIHSMLISCVAIGTNLIFGKLSDRNLSAAFFFGSTICTASLIFFLLWFRKAGKAQ